jgi:hypothetical protein
MQLYQRRKIKRLFSELVYPDTNLQWNQMNVKIEIIFLCFWIINQHKYDKYSV